MIDITICPECGHHVSTPRIIYTAGLAIDPNGTIICGKYYLPISKSLFRLIHTLASSSGRPVKHETLLKVLNPNTNNIGTVTTQVKKAREILEGWGVKNVIQNIRGVGYYWALPVSYAMPEE